MTKLLIILFAIFMCFACLGKKEKQMHKHVYRIRVGNRVFYVVYENGNRVIYRRRK